MAGLLACSRKGTFPNDRLSGLISYLHDKLSSPLRLTELTAARLLGTFTRFPDFVLPACVILEERIYAISLTKLWLFIDKGLSVSSFFLRHNLKSLNPLTGQAGATHFPKAANLNRKAANPYSDADNLGLPAENNRRETRKCISLRLYRAAKCCPRHCLSCRQRR